MKTTDRKVVDDLRERYPKGTRVELIRMEDIQAPPAGTKGTVTAVDDMGTIHVRWDNGSSLGVAYGADACRVLIGEFTDTVRRQILAVRETGETNMFDVPMVQQIANRSRSQTGWATTNWCCSSSTTGRNMRTSS